MAEVTFIVYEGDDEVLVTTPEQEEAFLENYSPYRKWDEYDRTEYASYQVVIKSRHLLVTD